jgi:hypothetical protein
VALGAGLTPGEAVTVTLRSELAGTAVGSASCTCTFPAAALSASTPACALTTTGEDDSLADGLVPTGNLGLNAIDSQRHIMLLVATCVWQRCSSLFDTGGLLSRRPKSHVPAR